MMKKILPVLIPAACIFSYATAQQSDFSVSMDSVVVRENRIPTSYTKENRNIQIIDSKQISALPVKTTIELLSYVAGVDLRQRGPFGAQADVSIDGSTFDQVLVLINGVKMADPQTGHNMLNIPLPLTSIDHIEIISGPASRQYGVDAMAGAINIITKIPTENMVSAQAYGASSFQKDTSNGHTFYGWGAQASAALAGENTSQILSFAHDESNGYRYNTANNAYRAFYQNHINIDKKNSIDATGGYIYNTFGANSFYAAPYDAESKETIQTVVGSVGYTYHPNDRFSITPRISYWYSKDDYIFIRQDPDYYHNIHETNVVTGEVQSTYRIKHGVFGAGVELRDEDINSNNLGKHQRNNVGIYAEYKHNFSDRLNASAGVYGNANSDYGFEAFPSADIGYQVTHSFKLFANASTGERLPTYTDLYYISPTNINNPALRPEHTSYAEGGIQFNKSYLFLQASYFYKHTADFIDYVRSSDTAKISQARNFQSVNTPGIKVQAAYQLSRQLRLPAKYSLVLNASYEYLDPSIQVPNNEVSQYAVVALRHQAVISLRSLFFNRLQFDVNYRYLQRIGGNEYTLLDARLGYKIGKFDIYGDVNNILNTQYHEILAVPLPGRWYTIGVKFDATWK